MARLGHKRLAEAAGGGTDVPRAKRSRLQLEADATPSPAAAAAELVEMFKHGELFYEAKPSEELKCALCLEEITEQPAALRCGHIFGQGCLLAALAANRRCPTCRAAAGGAATDAVDTLVTPQHTVASLIDELRVHALPARRGATSRRRRGRLDCCRRRLRRGRAPRPARGAHGDLPV